MEDLDITELLESHGVKPTVNRIIVARALLDEGRPLSLMELEEKIGTVDKSGIFRSLMQFKEHHLVHSIEDGGDGTRYELCHRHGVDKDDDTHVHFFCERCHRTFCLEGVAIPPVTLPEGYTETTANYLVKGICPECSGGLS
jgi:Fur family transcriptional regulator, ferric uptake regulator